MDNKNIFDGVSSSQEINPDIFLSSWQSITNIDRQDRSISSYDNADSNQAQSTVDTFSFNYGEEVLQVDPKHCPDLYNLILKDEMIDETDYPAEATGSLPVVMKPSSLPASQNWPGDFEFDISFNSQEKKTKGVTWTYVEAKDKLYVGKEAPCPINFSTKFRMPEGVLIRAMALYSSPGSASEVVERCLQHRNEDISKDILEADHLVRCESASAIYEVDPNTGRYSVAIPFENPPPGQNFSTYIFKFACFTSCPGPNRRPLMLIFSLEKDNQVIGRKKVEIKICACPGRDSKTEEEQSTSSKKRKKKSEAAGSSKTFTPPDTNVSHVSKKAKGSPNEDGYYKILVKDRKCYEFLEQMKKYYNIVKTMKSMPSDVKKFLEQYQERKGYRIPQEISLLD